MSGSTLVIAQLVTPMNVATATNGPDVVCSSAAQGLKTVLSASFSIELAARTAPPRAP